MTEQNEIFAAPQATQEIWEGANGLLRVEIFGNGKNTPKIQFHLATRVMDEEKDHMLKYIIHCKKLKIL